MKLLIIILALFILIYVGPLIYLALTLPPRSDGAFANRESANIAPDPGTTENAVIQIYGARAYSWRGIFSFHTWLAIKEKGADSYTTYQVIGWRASQTQEVVKIRSEVPDRYWFGNPPVLLLNLQGKEAEELIPKIERAANQYPYPHSYLLWPGPNSNTFVASIARAVPELKFAMPPNAVGKDFLPNGALFDKAPSGTGYQFSFYGIFGVLIALKEGVEIDLMGLVIGFDPQGPAIYLPGIGRIGWPHHDLL